MVALKTDVQSHVLNGTAVHFVIQGKMQIGSVELEWTFLSNNLAAL